MLKLMKKLRDLDPELHKRITDMMLPESNDTNIEINLYITSGCIQRAIQARGWVFDIEGYRDDFYENEKGYCAGISSVGPGYDGDCWNEKHLNCIVEKVADAPAAAILAAYVDAMEASQ